MARVKSYDKLPINTGIVLDLPHREGVGVKTFDISRSKINMDFVAAPAWTPLASRLKALTYDGLNDYLECPAADSVALNFTSEDFTLLAWCYVDLAATTSDMIMCQSEVDVCGWEFYAYHDTLSINLRCNQLGSRTGIGAAGCYAKGEWFLAGVTRKGNTGQFYVNGLPVTTLGTLLDPVSAAGGQRLLIGRQWTDSNHWKGMMRHHRAWVRDIGAGAMASIWAAEHAAHGV